MEDLSRQPDIPLDLIGPGASTVTLRSRVAGDTNQRFTLEIDGSMSWGPGSGPADLTLDRTAAGVLTLTGELVVDGIGVGQATSGASILGADDSAAIVSAAAAVWNAVDFITANATLSGSTNITTATGFNFFQLPAPNISSALALTISHAATFVILGAPAAGGAGPATITNSYALWVYGGASRFGGQILAKPGTKASPSYAIFGQPTDGVYSRTGTVLNIALGGADCFEFQTSGFQAASTSYVGFNGGAIGSASPDVMLWRDTAAVLALKNAGTAQAFRIYGTATGPKYLSLSHNGTNALIDVSSGGGSVTIGATATSVTMGVQALAVAGSAAAPGWSFVGQTGDGMYSRTSTVLDWALGGAACLELQTSGLQVASASYLGFNGGTLGSSSPDVMLWRDAAAVLALKNAGTAQAFRVYGTATGPKYLSLSHNGTNALIDVSSAGGNITIGATATSVTMGVQALAVVGSAAAPGWSFVGQTGDGMYSRTSTVLDWALGGTAYLELQTSGLQVASAAYLGFNGGTLGSSSPDVMLWRDAAAVLALKDSGTAQAFRVYGTTTGPKYLSVGHDGTNGVVSLTGGGGLTLPVIASNLTPSSGNDGALDLGSSIARWRTISASQSIGIYLNNADANYSCVLGPQGIAFGAGGASSVDTILGRDGANVLYLKNGTTAQEFRVYGTTTGPKYLSFKHDGTNGLIDVSSGGGNITIGSTASSVTLGVKLLTPGGSAGAPTHGFTGQTDGMYSRGSSILNWSIGGSVMMEMQTNILMLNSTGLIGFNSSTVGTGSIDTYWSRGAAGVMELKNGASAQTLRVYGTTTGSKYISVAHDGTNAYLTSTAGQIAFGSAALATNATVNFVCLGSCAGAPSGTPASIPTGQIPMIIDTTNVKIYAYMGGAWKSVGLA